MQNSPVEPNLMGGFRILDTLTSHGSRPQMAKNAISYDVEVGRITINSHLSGLLIEGKFLCCALAYNDITEETALVFSTNANTNGHPLRRKSSKSNSVTINSKVMAATICEKLGIDIKAKSKGYIYLNKNISKNPNYMFFTLKRSEEL